MKANQCPHCKFFPARAHILWANQHGREIRFFCGCKTWWDVKFLTGKTPVRTIVQKADDKWLKQ